VNELLESCEIALGCGLNEYIDFHTPTLTKIPPPKWLALPEFSLKKSSLQTSSRYSICRVGWSLEASPYHRRGRRAASESDEYRI
jgi:hypothetical protein